MHPSTKAILPHFEYDHLPDQLQAVSRPICELARTFASSLEGPEVTVGLRKLLEAKDCLVRAKRETGAEQRPSSDQGPSSGRLGLSSPGAVWSPQTRWVDPDHPVTRSVGGSGTPPPATPPAAFPAFPVAFTAAERVAVIGWAGMAGVGFTYGPEPLDPNDPSISALRKLTASTAVHAAFPVAFTAAERVAVIGWAGMAGVGFTYGPEPLDPNDPSLTALGKLKPDTNRQTSASGNDSGARQVLSRARGSFAQGGTIR